MRENADLFDRYDCCARLYWRRKPLKQTEQKIVLIGSGKYANRLLERALLNNVLSPEQEITYRMFGDWETFCDNHHMLSDMVNVNEAGEKNDTLYFHEESWNFYRPLIENADRVILCEDCDEDNLEILSQIRKSYNLRSSIHIRSMQNLNEVYTFGTEEIVTPELLMGMELNKVAMLMNEIYCGTMCENAPEWHSLSEFTKQSNIAAAEHLLVKVQILLGDDIGGKITKESYAEAYSQYVESKAEKQDIYRKLEHERWVRFHVLNNWKYGPVRNNQEKIHPLLVPFEDLSAEEQAKDDVAWELLKVVSEQL